MDCFFLAPPAERKSFPDEFNDCIQLIRDVKKEVFPTETANQKTNSSAEHETRRLFLLKQGLDNIQLMLDNEYFHFMFVHNLIIKRFCLNFIQYIIEDQGNTEQKVALKLSAYKILGRLVEWDFNLAENQFRGTSTGIVYAEYFTQLMPYLVDSLYAMNKKQQFSNDERQDNPNSIFYVQKDAKYDVGLFNLNKLICFLISSVSFEHLIAVRFLPDSLDLLFNQLLSPLLYAQLCYTISNNICGYNQTGQARNESSQISEKLRIEIHEKCSAQTIKQMEVNVRNSASRSLLKKALNNYCQYIIEHKNELVEICAQANQDMNFFGDILDKDLENKMSDFNKLAHAEITTWQESLYTIVINLVRILRIEFENNQNHVEIDLVIYFYELLLTNIDNLVADDAANIANKLMPVLIKINTWRTTKMREAVKIFTNEQGEFLFHMSFKLVDKFMQILEGKFISEGHLKEFTPIWLGAINDWYPMSYQIVMTFCIANRNMQSFITVKELANVIMDSWDSNKNLPNGKLTKKKFNYFLCDESLAAFVEMTYFYDFMISQHEGYFKDFKQDIMPILEIVRNILIPMKTKNRFIMFCKFYQSLFSLQSPLLKQISMWKNDIILIMLRLESLGNVAYDFVLDDEIYTHILALIISLVNMFDKDSFFMAYHATVTDTLTHIDENITTKDPRCQSLLDHFDCSN